MAYPTLVGLLAFFCVGPDALVKHVEVAFARAPQDTLEALQAPDRHRRRIATTTLAQHLADRLGCSHRKPHMEVGLKKLGAVASAALLLVAMAQSSVSMGLLQSPDAVFHEWTEIAGMLGPMVVAALVGYVAYLQHLTSKEAATLQIALQRDQVRLAQFDRRYALYRRFREVQGEMFREGACSRDAALEATNIGLDAKFLFESETEMFLDRFQNLAWELHNWPSLHEEALRNNPSRVQSEIERRTKLMEQLSAGYAEGEKVFKSAMSVGT
jgi:hypothetical protein